MSRVWNSAEKLYIYEYFQLFCVLLDDLGHLAQNLNILLFIFL